ncbi:MAG: DNA methylase [Anaerolineae bacterium]|nr:DNA methylase [Anaerolineae bacterium]
MTHQPALFTEPTPAASGPVECLGLTFENDAARRAYFTEKLREKLQDPAFRQIEGFPLGSDEDILALSDPPYYTACPNPFLEDFVKYYGKPYDPTTDQYRREPFAADVSEGKNDPIYNAHSYHTKVPHKAIMRYILHYTQPGDVVFDGFCGTGMTGIAAQLCGDKRTVESLGYLAQPDGKILDEQGRFISLLGPRRAVLCDLSPAATFIAYNYSTPVDVAAFEQKARRILQEVEEACGWMYETTHTDGKTKGKINYTVWSDMFVCPVCGAEIVFWDAAVDQAAGKVRDSFPCPGCGAMQSKRTLQRAWETVFDHTMGQTIRRAKQTPVLINYSVGQKRYEKVPDKDDSARIRQIEESGIPYWFPTDRMPEGDEARRNDDIGITNIHHFYTRRNLWLLAALWSKANTPLFRWVTSSVMQRANKQHQIAISRVGGEKKDAGGKTAGHRRGTLYVPSNQVEFSVFALVHERLMNLKRISSRDQILNEVITVTQSSNSFNIPAESVDYLFVDPPFGANIMYSELNFLWETWLRVYTNNKSEAVVNKTQQKRLADYQYLMELCFREFFRVLKPGRWITVEFHNSQNSVWNTIQESLLRAGFMVADVRTLDKEKKTHTQVTASGSVNQDLIISAYKPNGGLEERFKLEAGTTEGAWDFVRTHLRQLPVFASKDGRVEVIAERLNFLLFDRMVAFHVQRGVTVPLSAAEFYAGLEQRFPKRDEMYFLPDQVAEYDQKRMLAKGIEQLQLFVTDESSAIQWLHQQLTRQPQTFQEIHPHFMREIGGWQKHEKPLELADLLEQNFLRYEGETPVPAQLWVSFEQDPDWQALLKGYSPDNPPAGLQREARHHWYVPDPTRAADLEKLRERELLKEFEEYRQSKQKKLKVFRLEAVRAGFKKAWQDQQYRTIIEVAEKIPDTVLQEDSKLLMWYDQAVTRLEN